MKNFILSLIVCACCSVSFGGDCTSGQCRQPVRNAISTVGRVVTAPVRVTRNVANNVRCRRVCRQSMRCR